MLYTKGNRILRTVVCCVSLLLCVETSAQLQSYKLDFTLSKKKFADTIRIKYENGQVLVPVDIDGKRYQFLLDTGASQGSIFHDTKIKSSEAFGQIRSSDGNNNKDTLQMVRIPRVTIGTLSIKNYRAMVLRHSRLRNANCDGILGFDLVKKGLLMKIDVRNGLLILTDLKHHFDADRGNLLKFKKGLQTPYIEVTPFMGYSEQALFDTGSKLFYSINREQFKKNEHKMVNRAQIEGRSFGCVTIGHMGAEAMDEVVLLSLESLCVGNFLLKDVHVFTSQTKSHLGAGILKYCAVTFNPFKGTVNFEPYDGVKSCVVGNKQIEISIVPNKGGRPMVGFVWEKSEYYKAGFRTGDILVAVDGKPLNSIEDYKQFLSRHIKNQFYTFTVNDKNGRRRIIKSRW